MDTAPYGRRTSPFTNSVKDLILYSRTRKHNKNVLKYSLVLQLGILCITPFASFYVPEFETSKKEKKIGPCVQISMTIKAILLRINEK